MQYCIYQERCIETAGVLNVSRAGFIVHADFTTPGNPEQTTSVSPVHTLFFHRNKAFPLIHATRSFTHVLYL